MKQSSRLLSSAWQSTGHCLFNLSSGSIFLWEFFRVHITIFLLTLTESCLVDKPLHFLIKCLTYKKLMFIFLILFSVQERRQRMLGRKSRQEKMQSTIYWLCQKMLQTKSWRRTWVGILRIHDLSSMSYESLINKYSFIKIY